MLKLTTSCWRKPGMESAEFYAYWLGNHADLTRTYAATIGFNRCIQLHKIASSDIDEMVARYGLGDSPDGATSLWFRDQEDLLRSMKRQGDSGSAAVFRADEKNFTDSDNLTTLVSREEVIIAQDVDAPKEQVPAKLIIKMWPKAGLSSEAFLRRWRGSHADLVKELGGVIGVSRYVQNQRDLAFPLDISASRGRPSPGDGIAEFWWPSLEEAERFLAQDGARAAFDRLWQDKLEFVDPSRMTAYLAKAVTIVG